MIDDTRRPDGASAEPTALALLEAVETEEAGTDLADDIREDHAPRTSTLVRAAMIAAVVVLTALAGVTGWLAVRAHAAHEANTQRRTFVEVGRQEAVNLTTIDWHHPDSDVQRIIDLATGSFHDEFQQRSQPFVDVVKKAQSTTVGTVTAAGIESESGSQAQVLVAVSVKTSNAGADDPTPRSWRMRLTVQKAGDQMKVANVEFIQ
jgi:Mce-associated membrane protein